MGAPDGFPLVNYNILTGSIHIYCGGRRLILSVMHHLGTVIFPVLVALLQIGWVAAQNLPFNGADISSLPMLESQGIRYSDNGQTKAFETILASHGFKLTRIRVWTAGTYTQSYALNLTRRAKNAGMKILIDLHYSDTCTFDVFPLPTQMS